VLNGKLIFYEKGMVFIDNRMHAAVMPYDHVKTMTIYQEKEWWLEIVLEENENSPLSFKNLMPCNLIGTNKLFIKVDQKFFNEKFYALEKHLLIDDVKYISKMKKSYDECPIVNQS